VVNLQRLKNAKKITLEQPNAFNLVVTHWTFHKTPCVVKFGLGGDVRFREFLLVLASKHLETKSMAAGKQRRIQTSSSSYDRETSASAA